MAESIIEFVKFVGGLGGLASATFLIYDRLFRTQPSAFLVPVEYKTSVRIRNISAETIILDRLLIKPPMLELARANDLITKEQERATAFYPTAKGGEPSEEVFIVIHPMGERTFALHRLADFENASGETKITIRLRWKNTRKPIPLNRYVRIKTNVQEIRNLREASLAGKA